MFLWIDFLTVSSVLRLALLHRDQHVEKVFYLKATALGSVCAHLAGWLKVLPKDLQAVTYSLGVLRDPDGRALRYLVEEESMRLLDAVAPDLFHPSKFPACVAHLPTNKVYLFLYKSFAEAVHPSVLLMNLARCLTKQAGEGEPHIILNDPWVAGLIERAGLKSGNWVHVPMPRWLDHLLRESNRARLVMISALRMVAIAFRVVVPGQFHPMEKTSATVVVQKNDGIDPRFRSDIFWLPGSGIDPASILIYFKGTRCAPQSSDIDAMEHQGVNWISFPGLSIRQVLRATVACRSLPKLLQRTLAPVVAHLRRAVALLREPDPEQFWRETWILRLMELVEWWEAFFRHYRAIAHIHTQDTGTPMVAQSIAIDLAGGISIGYHWSYLFLETSTHAQDHTVYFSWGPYYDSFLKRPPSQITHLLYSGYLSCRTEPPSAERACRLRQSLEARGSDYVIGLFDSSFDDSIHISKAMCLELYEAVLGLVSRDPSLGLILKPKDNNNLSLLPEIRPAIERLCKEGRCVVLDSKVMAAEAALAADIVVGLGLNSAVIEGALLAGKPGLHCDLSRKRDDRLYRWGYGRVVFDNTDRLLDAIEEHRRGSRRDIGDHTAILAEIDPYQDGAGAGRIGEYLRWYWDSRVEGQTREAALAYANTRYEERWGTRKNAALAEDRRVPVPEKLSC